MIFRSKNNKPLYDLIACRNPDLARAVEAAFDTLQLPLPQAQEYFCTGDQGYIGFSNIHGCTIRVSSTNLCPAINHDRILQPLISLPALHYKVDVKPGVELSHSKFVSLYLRHLLKHDQIDFYDANRGNSGLIPARLSGTKLPYAVMIDDGAVRKLTESCREIGAVIQERLYGDLKEAFTTARDALAPEQPELMRTAWQKCARAQEEGRLICGWQTLRPRFENDFRTRILKAAETYSAALLKLNLS